MSFFKRNGSNNWWYKFQLNGRLYSKSTGTTVRREAEIAARAWRAEVEATTESEPILAPTFSVLRDLDVARARAAKCTDVYIRGMIEPHWRTLAKHIKHPENVTNQVLLDYVDRRKVSGKSLRNELITLKRGLRLAKRKGLRVEVPEDWPLPALGDTDEKLQGHFYGNNKMRHWLGGLSGEAFAMALLALLTGLRRAELYRIRPEWVEFCDAGEPLLAVLHLPKGKTKGRRERFVGLCPSALAALQAFPRFKGDHKRAFRTAARAAGIPGGVVHLRDCRHTFATVADKAGDPRGVDMVMGHASGTVARRYQHADIPRLANIALYVEKWLLGTVAGTVVKRD